MSRHTIISPAQNLIHEVVSRLESGTNDFSGSIIVFPGKRPAHFVRKALAERLHGSFIPPRMFSIDSFIEHLVSERLECSSPPLDNFDALALLFDIHTSIPDNLGGEHFNSIDRFIGLGLKLFSELEELVMADVDVRRIQDAMQSVPLGRLQSLPVYYQRFYSSVEKNGFTTRSLNYRTVAEKIDSIDFSSHASVIIAGFYAYTVLEQRILTNLLRRENISFVAQQGPGLQKQLKSISVEVDVQDPAGPVPGSRCYFYKASDTHGQVFAVSRKIKTMLESAEPVNERTVIVLPTADALFPVVHQTLPLLEQDQYNIALGYPLQRTPLFGFLSNLMTLATGARHGNVPASEYTTFVLHPYTKNILLGRGAEITRVLFHAIETHLAENQSNMFLSLEALEEDNTLLDGVCKALAAGGTEVGLSDLKSHLRSIHDHTVRSFLTFESLGDFARKSIEILQYIHKQSTAARHPLFRPYAERFIHLFDSIRGSMLATKHFKDTAAYCTFLRNTVAAEEVPFPGTPLKGLQVLGVLETRNLSFDTVFLLNATDDVLPGTRGHDVLLPQPLREKLGLETYREREQLIEYYFNILLAGAKNVHCFFTESGNHEKSRFLEKIIWEEQRKRKNLDVTELVHGIHYNVQLSTPKPESIGKSALVLDHLKEFEYTATALDRYLKCPLQFYYAHVLKLSEKDEVAEEIDQLEVGSFVHKVLTTYFQSMVGRPLTVADLDRRRLGQLIEKLYAEEYGSELVGPAYLVKQQVTRQLDAFLHGYQIPMVETGAVTLLALEQAVSVHSGGYAFAGRIDRIEQRGDKHVILDYKTGRDDSRVKIDLDKLNIDDPRSWRQAIGSFQLTMYMLLYFESRNVPIDSILPAYLFLGRNEITPEIEMGIGGGKHTASEIYEAVHPVLFRVIGEILDSRKHFEPTEQLHDACPNCPYRAMCGTSWVSG